MDGSIQRNYRDRGRFGCMFFFPLLFLSFSFERCVTYATFRRDADLFSTLHTYIYMCVCVYLKVGVLCVQTVWDFQHAICITVRCISARAYIFLRFSYTGFTQSIISLLNGSKVILSLACVCVHMYTYICTYTKIYIFLSMRCAHGDGVI